MFLSYLPISPEISKSGLNHFLDHTIVSSEETVLNLSRHVSKAFPT